MNLRQDSLDPSSSSAFAALQLLCIFDMLLDSVSMTGRLLLLDQSGQRSTDDEPRVPENLFPPP